MRRAACPDGCSLRLEIERGTILLWPDGYDRPEPGWFDPERLAASGRASSGGLGRGATVRFESEGRTLILRHYRRGGMASRFVDDQYLRVGLRRSRPWRELALLTRLEAGGMPVPPPVAARLVIGHPLSPWYRGDLITGYVHGTATLAQALRAGTIDESIWHAIGVTIARFHDAGVDHADLNAHNVLLDEAGRVYLIDFDRARLRVRGGWRRRNLARLRRSLDKLGGVIPDTSFGPSQWRRLLAGYDDSVERRV